MKIRERVTIDASPATIWPFVADPVGQATWNPKLIAVDRASKQPVVLGEKFKAIYRLSGRDGETEVEVTACQPPNQVTFRHHPAGMRGYVEESYDLSDLSSAECTRLVQTIDFSHTLIPWYFKTLMWLLATFGYSTEEPYLERLKRIVETGASAM